MKKLVSLVLALVLVLTATAAFARGEDFELHNGTTFGMTRSEIIEIESSMHGITFENRNNNDGSTAIDGRTTIGGIPNTEISYEFPAGSDVCAMFGYGFEVSASNSETFAAVEEALTVKYGPTDYNTATGKEYPQFGTRNAFTAPYTTFGSFTRMEYSHRFFQTEGGAYIFIEHYRTDNGWHKVLYRALTDDQANVLLVFEGKTPIGFDMDSMLMDL